jgi:hypothetical protein
MSVENFNIKIRKDTHQALKDIEKVNPVWMQQVVSLGLLVSRGEVYQRLGKEFLKLSMRDIDPLPKAGAGDTEAKLLNYTLGEDICSTLRTYGFINVTDWLSRATALRLRAEEMNLLMKSKGRYARIDFSIK